MTDKETIEKAKEQNKNDFTEEEIKAALLVKEQMIKGIDHPLQAIYMAGEICMHVELKQALREKIVKQIDSELPLNNDIYKECYVNGLKKILELLKTL